MIIQIHNQLNQIFIVDKRRDAIKKYENKQMAKSTVSCRVPFLYRANCGYMAKKNYCVEWTATMTRNA